MPEYIWNLSELKDVPQNGRTVFSCFSCGGGSSMGYKLAGYTVVGNCEIDPKINNMYVKNFQPRFNYRMSVADFPSLDNLPEELFHLDILDGSPPCSTFSTIGNREEDWGRKKKFREGQADQVISDLFFDFIRVAEKLQPKVVVAENVKGLILGNARGYMNLILKEFSRIGYDCQVFLLNAATMGVPQKRERVFIIARRKDLHYGPLKLAFSEKPICYGEFASEPGVPLNPDTMTFNRWRRRRADDTAIKDTVARTEGGKLSGFALTYAKKNSVCNTLTAGNGFLRFDVPAMVSDRDLKCIQTFPQDYDFCGNSVNYVCGMSVPPLMMKRIAAEIYKQWFQRRV